MVTLQEDALACCGSGWISLFKDSFNPQEATLVGIVYGKPNVLPVYRTHLRILDDQKVAIWDQESWLLGYVAEYYVCGNPKESPLLYESLMDGKQHLRGSEIFGWIP